VGDWEDIEVGLGLKEPPPMSEEDKFHLRGILDSLEKLTGESRGDADEEELISDQEMMRMASEYTNQAIMPGGFNQAQKAAKQKTKNQMAKQSRQKNRPKKKKKKK
jgi:hypothetical protein